MLKRKVAIVTITAMIANSIATPISVLANELQEKNMVETAVKMEKEKNNSKEATVTKFKLYDSEKLPVYNEVFKIDTSNILKVSNNGGNYGSSTLDKIIDGNLSTHWETGKQNSLSFKNEIVFELNELTVLNRIIYKGRPGNKGFAQEFEIHGSKTSEGDNFELVATGESAISGDLLEFKFNPTEFKRIKFVFTQANQNWAAASEFMFYKEDAVSDKMAKLFTDDTLSVVDEEFNSIDKINVLDEEVKNHPLYEDFKEDIENAKAIIEKKVVDYTDAKVSTFKNINSEELIEYNKLYKISSSKIENISNNGGHYASNTINKAIDEDASTNWHSGKQNTASFNNGVIINLDELTTLNRIVYTVPRGTNRGFAEAFDIYASRTSKGDTFELVSSGASKVTQDSIEIRFNPTEFKRIKFVFKKGYENWACATEFGLYTQDKIAEKMDRLFTDSTMSKVSEEFNSVEKINTLNEEAKNHPFYEDYKENILNAIALVEQGEVIAVDAIITKFTQFYTPYINSYDKEFRIDSNKIESISNNGGQYGGSALKYAIDNDVNTHWETGKPNSSSFKNEINITLESVEVINRLVYKSRNGCKGFAKEFSIYASPTTKGDNFSKVTTGKYTSTSDLLEIQFDKTNVKRLKFVFDDAQEGWASIGDLRLYKEDKISDNMETLFTNGLMNEVSEEFNTIDKLNSLENDIKGHPLEAVFKEDIEMAKQIINGQLDSVKVVTAEQHGNMTEHASKNLKFGFGNNNQPTGVYAKPGDKITIYVDADPNQPLPTLMFSQQEGSFANWGRTVSLHPGRNIITVPEVAKDSWYKHDVTKGGPIYIVNPYTQEQQSKAPIIRFNGGDKFPFATKDINVEEFKEFLIEYKKKIDEDIKNNPNVLDREVIDTFEFVSDHIVFTGTATGAYEAYINQGINPLDTIKSYNIHMNEIFKYYGLDKSDIKNDPMYIRENVRLAQPFGYMYAYSGHIGVQRDVMTNHLIPFENRGPSWGLTHEIGHKMDVGTRVLGEVTNNMLPMHMSVFYNQMDNRIPYESHIYKNVIKENLNSHWSQGYFERLAVFWQLEMYKPGYWADLNRFYRERDVKLDSNNQNSSKMQYLVEFSSEALGLDLSEHFARHGFEVNDETREKVSKYPKPEGKVWYLNNSVVGYEKNGFNDKVYIELNIDTNKTEAKNLLAFNINSENIDHLLGYEIYRDNELIGFTSNATFEDSNIDVSSNYNYTVVAYDKKLNKSEPVEIKAFTPLLLVEDEIATKLYEEFDPLNHIIARSHEGEDLKNEVVVNSNVDTSKRGNYEVSYKIVSEGSTIEKVTKVNVVSDYYYASDLQEVSHKVGWGKLQKDKSVSGQTIRLIKQGMEKTYSKGLGAHANSEIIYNIENEGYDYFEANIGIDQAMKGRSSSATFEIWIDGEKKFNSKVFKSDTAYEFIRVPVNGAKEVKLITTDSNDGNNSEHTIWADAKFTSNSIKPVITVEDKKYKIGETIDFLSGVTAKDIEDGDITSNVEIISNTYEESKIGRFEVVYKVTDSDNNVAKKKSYVTIYEDFTVVKSKYGYFDNLDSYNEEFKIPVVSVTNNGGKYGNSIIENAIDNNRNSHWETGKPNSSSFNNEVVFDLGEVTEINRIAYAARNGGKGFAKKFEIYISTEAEGNDFILGGRGEYNGNINDVIEFKISKTNARRVKLKFIEANQGWASIGEVSFYKEDALSDKINNDIFTDSTKTNVTESYNTLEKVQSLREEVSNHPASSLFEEELIRAEEIIKAKIPTLTVGDTAYVKLNSNYDAMSEVTANDQEDGDITDRVVVNSGEFTTSKTGEYTITYNVTDNDGNVVSAENKVVVYSDTKFVSEVNWESARTDYGEVRKDLASSGAKIKLGLDGGEKIFDKGIGTHANAEIVYNLEGTEYEYFESYVGVDRNIARQNKSSIIFQVLADGKKIYDSGLMKWDDEAKLVRVSLKDVSELKLIIDNAGNGNSSDHGSFGDAKFLTTNSKPTLTIPKDINTKLGVSVDLDGEYSATDIEDGDITSNVTVEGQANFNKPGTYSITYSVTDSDENIITAVRKVKVVDMNDSIYLSDIDWKSSNNSYGRATKDISASGRTLRLTDENGNEVAYEKGIGTHSTSTIIYDLTGKDYGYFTSYVGVDRHMFGTVGSVTFEVWLDGSKVYDSGVMNSRNSQKFVEVNLAGAKEMKLIATDGGNGNGSDHATWGDSKLHYAKSEAVEVNKELLDNLLAKIEGMNLSNYEEEGWNNLMNVKANVLQKLEDGYNQEEIDDLYSELSVAKESLKLVVSYEGLVELINSTKELKEYLYTGDSWNVLKNSIAKSEGIIEIKDSTMEEVQSAVEELNNAISSLVERIEKNELQELIVYSDTITDISFVGAANHIEARWSNFQVYKEIAKESLVDTNITNYETNLIISNFKYYISELQMK